MNHTTLRSLHRWSAFALALFLAAHLANHFAGLFSITAHQSIMAALRTVYRQLVVEFFLLAMFTFQAFTGLIMAWRGYKNRRGFVAHFQAYTGIYLALFLVIHVGAVLSGRSNGLDTDFRFAAAGLHVEPYQWFFIPYYFLALFCLFSHVGCAVYWNTQNPGFRARHAILAAFAFCGIVAGGTVVSAMAGFFYPVEIPSEYRASFGH